MFAEYRTDWHNSLKEKSDKTAYMRKMHAALMEMKDAHELLADSIINKIELSKSGVNIELNKDYGEIKIFVNENDFEEVPVSILCFGNYETEETNMVCKILELNREKDFTVFDIGANIGWYTMNILKRYPEIKVYSFEPGPVTFERLVRNIELNDTGSQNTYNIGFYKEDSELDFYYDSEGSGASSLVNLRDKESAKKISVKVRKMDNWVKENSVDKVDFIKCDVEGAELFVYEGGRHTIEKYKPIIFSEMLRKWSQKFNYHPNDIIHMMEEIGYHCFVLAGNNKLKRFGYVNEETIETNYFFLHPQKHALFINDLCVK